MRILAIGDIHGCSHALNVLLDAVTLRPDDLVVLLGDYVDRGPDSCGVLDRLVTLHGTHNLVALRGNHEEMMLEARWNPGALSGWVTCGGREALASYRSHGGRGDLKDVPEKHWHFLEIVCRDWHESEQHLFAHACLDGSLPMREQPGYLLRWEPVDQAGPHFSGKVLVCGHTEQRSGLPLDLGHAICIDTWAYGNGWLTCLDVTTDRVWQANQRGARRAFWLDDVSGQELVS